MLLSLNWLREFVPYTGEVQTLCDRLTMLGLEVEEIRYPFAPLDKIVVGHVVERVAHPSADHLSCCKVDLGYGEIVDIVCGAPNVASGQKVPVAPIGAVMPDGLAIKKAKLRGQVSCGMICSERELGLSEDHSGIMVLDANLQPGMALAEALNLDQIVLDVGITPNRADCLSVLGLAREVAMAFNLPLTMPQFDVLEQGEAFENFTIDPDPHLCSLYQARCIRNVQIGPSPQWLRYRLLAVGLRPINNIVDTTNYVLMECGQPLHAFDGDKILGHCLRVQCAQDDMEFTTLDGQKRQLTKDDLLIWDAKRPVALAGVMGGANSEISDSSSTVFLESAVFHPVSVRRTARRLGLSSDASYRFERGVDHICNTWAMNRAASLMAQLAGGAVAPGVARSEPRPFVATHISYTPAKASTLLGLSLTNDFSHQTLTQLGCQIDDTQLPWTVTAPSYRLDLVREVDLIEEVARVYGMDQIPATLPAVRKSLDDLTLVDPTYDFINEVKDWGRGVGLAEVVNYSFVGTADLNKLGLSELGRVHICNPLSEEMNVLRTEIAPGLLHTLRHNMSQDNVRVRIFEIAHSFVHDGSCDTATKENNRLGILLHGNRFPGRFPYTEGTVGYADIKGLVEHLLLAIHVGSPKFVQGVGHPYLSPEVEIQVQGQGIGRLGKMRDDLADFYLARHEAWYADLDLDLLMHMRGNIVFRPLPRFPVVRRDMTFIAPHDLAIGDIIDTIMALQEPLLEDVYLVNVYEPAESSARNLSFRFIFRHPEKTLKDKEVDKITARISQHLLKQLPVHFS